MFGFQKVESRSFEECFHFRASFKIGMPYRLKWEQIGAILFIYVGRSEPLAYRTLCIKDGPGVITENRAKIITSS